MLVKVVFVFLLAMALVAMIGRVMFPGMLRLRRTKALRPKTCDDCGRFLIGATDCDCGRHGRKG